MAKRSLIAVGTIAVLGAIVLSGVAVAAPKATIAVGNNFLSPASKTVVAGTEVRFRWAGGETHKIVKRKGPGDEVRSAAKASRGVHLAKVLSKRGEYRFVCSFHPTEMRLKLTVK
jgi:plastocyanin